MANSSLKTGEVAVQSQSNLQENSVQSEQGIGISGSAASQIVSVKRKHVGRLSANEERIRSFFGVILEPVTGQEPCAISNPVVLYNLVRPADAPSSSGVDNDRKEDTGTLSSDGGDGTVPVQQEEVLADDLAKRVQVSDSGVVVL